MRTPLSVYEETSGTRQGKSARSRLRVEGDLPGHTGAAAEWGTEAPTVLCDGATSQNSQRRRYPSATASAAAEGTVALRPPVAAESLERV